MENETTYVPTTPEDGEVHHHTEVSLSISVKQYVNSMYEEFKRWFEARNMSRIDKILKNITNVDPSSNILNIICGSLALVNGKVIESYNLLFKYAQNCATVDLWALNIMGMWNQFAGEQRLALKQFGRVMEGQFSNKYLVSVLINSAKVKKRLGFLDRALEYLERLLCCPRRIQDVPHHQARDHPHLHPQEKLRLGTCRGRELLCKYQQQLLCKET